MRHDEPSPALRRAYEAEPETAEPSDALWGRTRNALAERGLLRRGRPSGPRWSVAAWMAAASFAGGILIGTLLDGGAADPGTSPEALDPILAAERAQAAATEYAIAVATLVRSLDAASAREMATGREVVRSASRAHAASARPLLAGASETLGESTAAGPAEDPVIWF